MFNKLRATSTTLLLVIIGSVVLRAFLFQFPGGDQQTYKSAVEEFYQGRNPYQTTVTSYENEETEHGYAYFPTLLYIQTFFYWLNSFFDLDQPLHMLWKIPILLSDYLIALLIFKEITKRSKNKVYPLLATAGWLFNPYILTRFEINSYDIIGIAFLLLGVFIFENSTAKRKDFYTGLLLFLAGSIKLFSFVIYPYIFLKSEKKTHLLAGSGLAAFVTFLPFLKSLHDFMLMLQGSIFVHSQRGYQGRSLITFLSSITQNIGINLTQPFIFEVLAVTCLIGATLLSIYFYIKKVGVYKALTLSTLFYILITPVLSRTHLYWLFPFVLIVFSEGSLVKQVARYFLFFVTTYLYLFFWNAGYEIGEGGKVISPKFLLEDTRIYKLYKYGKYQT